MGETTDEKTRRIADLEVRVEELEDMWRDASREADTFKEEIEEYEEKATRSAEIREEMLELLRQIDDAWRNGRTVTIPAGSLFGLRVRDAVNKSEVQYHGE